MSNKRLMVGLAFFSLLILVLAPASQGEDGFNIQNYNPNLFGGDFFAFGDAQSLEQLSFGFGLFYIYSPSLMTVYVDGEPEFDLISKIQTLSFSGAIGIMDWWSFGIGVPMASLASREMPDADDLDDRMPLEESGNVMADMRIEMKFAALTQDPYWIGMAISPYVTFPTGNIDKYASDGRATYGTTLALQHDFDYVNVAANFGYQYRGTGEVLDFEVGNAFSYGLGVAKTFDFGFGLGLEYWGKLYDMSSENSDFKDPMELLFTLRYTIPRGPRFVVGTSAGLTQGIGTPSYRMVGGIDYFYTRPETGTLVVDTRDPQGTTMAAELTVSGPTGEQTKVASPGVHTDAVKPGTYTITASAEGFLAETRTFDIRRGKQSRLTMVLSALPEAPKTALSITLTDHCTQDPMSAQLILDNGSVYALENGSFEQEMEPGDYKGTIKADGYADRAVEFSIKQDEATTHEWAMARPFTTPEKINFAGNSATLMPESKTELDAFAQQIKGLCEFKEIVVSGHTSLDKSDSENTMLSRARAQAVVDYLAGQGVDRTKLRVVGLGKSNPLAPNISSWGRKLNERIEFKLKK